MVLYCVGEKKSINHPHNFVCACCVPNSSGFGRKVCAGAPTAKVRLSQVVKEMRVQNCITRRNRRCESIKVAPHTRSTFVYLVYASGPRRIYLYERVAASRLHFQSVSRERVLRDHAGAVEGVGVPGCQRGSACTKARKVLADAQVRAPRGSTQPRITPPRWQVPGPFAPPHRMVPCRDSPRPPPPTHTTPFTLFYGADWLLS